MIMGHWTWLIIGLILLTLEMLTPGYFLLFIGASAVLTGGLFMMVSGTWQTQALIFALLSIGLVILAWKNGFYKDKQTDSPHLNEPKSALLGQNYTLFTPIENGRGMIKIGDALWSVKGEDLAIGTQIRIINFNDTDLIVEKA